VSAQGAFQIAGRVAKVFAEEGQAVSKGQVLAELDTTDYSNAYDAAQGQADAARAVDDKAQQGPVRRSWRKLASTMNSGRTNTPA